MGRLFLISLEGKIYSCKHCQTHLALADNIVSKEAAYDKSQKYKEGKFILERFKVSGPDGSHYWVTHDTHMGGSDVDDANES